MTKREKSIYEAGEALLAERLSQNIAVIEADMQREFDTHSGIFFDTMHDLLTRAASAQEQGEQGQLCYICISYLLSSLHTGSHKLRIDAYDERHYGDQADSHVCWSPRFIFKHLDSDMAHFRKHIGQKIAQIQEHEIIWFMKKYSMYYFQIALQFAADLIESVVPEAQPLTVTFGGYMDEAVIIYDAEAV